MYVAEFVDRWQNVRAGLLAVLDRFEDADLAFAPFEGGRDVGAMLRHIPHEEAIEAHYGLMRALPDVPPEFSATEYPSVASIRALLDRVHGETEAYLRALPPGALTEEVEVAWGQRGPLGDFLWHILEHEVHHRGELSLCLGLLGREGLDA